MISIRALASVVLLTAQAVSSYASSKIVTIDNTKPRLDTFGNIINAHDGTVKFFDGPSS